MATILKIVIKKGRMGESSDPFQYSTSGDVEKRSINKQGQLEKNNYFSTHTNDRLPLDLDNNFSPSDPPSLLLHLWSVLPILLIAEGDVGLASIAILAALINFFLVQLNASTVVRYLSSGFVSAIPFLLYFLVR
ncbi:MAG TPA: hypothetical protein ENJ33_04080 [Thiothrix sp.]|nr:hypothetical protein [Thiothrix sp.]